MPIYHDTNIAFSFVLTYFAPELGIVTLDMNSHKRGALVPLVYSDTNNNNYHYCYHRHHDKNNYCDEEDDDHYNVTATTTLRLHCDSATLPRLRLRLRRLLLPPYPLPTYLPTYLHHHHHDYYYYYYLYYYYCCCY